jgi:hypothetical protein
MKNRAPILTVLISKWTFTLIQQRQDFGILDYQDVSIEESQFNRV